MSKHKKEPKIVRDLREQVSYFKSEYKEAQSNADYYKGKYEQLEASENRKYGELSNDYQKNTYELEWLRMLVELITVPADKLEEVRRIKKERQDKRMGIGY